VSTYIVQNGKIKVLHGVLKLLDTNARQFGITAGVLHQGPELNDLGKNLKPFHSTFTRIEKGLSALSSFAMHLFIQRARYQRNYSRIKCLIFIG
jgi:hypothetical protein